MTIAIDGFSGKAINKTANYMAAKSANTRAGYSIKTAAVESAPMATDSSITELVFTRHSSDRNLLLLPMLCHLSRIADRWITWITATPISSQQLQEYGVDASKIRVIHTNNQQDPRWIFWEALHNGTSHTVIAFPESLSKDDIEHFEYAARQGGSSGLLIRYR